MIEIHLPLQGTTPLAWVSHILSNFDLFLLDHASCERKAAALAMSFISKYSDRKFLIEPMVSLAREELEHFAQVYRILQKRGIVHQAVDERDAYVNAMLQKLRHGREERFLDRLIVSGLIEARGWERFALLAQHLEDQELRTFYTELARRERGHYKIFINVAQKYFTQFDVDEAIRRISEYEGEAMQSAPLTARLH